MFVSGGSWKKKFESGHSQYESGHSQYESGHCTQCTWIESMWVQREQNSNPKYAVLSQCESGHNRTQWMSQNTTGHNEWVRTQQDTHAHAREVSENQQGTVCEGTQDANKELSHTEWMNTITCEDVANQTIKSYISWRHSCECPTFLGWHSWCRTLTVLFPRSLVVLSFSALSANSNRGRNRCCKQKSTARYLQTLPQEVLRLSTVRNGKGAV